MKDSMRAYYAPHPEHAGTEGFLEGVAVLPGPDTGHEQSHFSRCAKAAWGSAKLLYSGGTRMFQPFIACLFRLRPHCVPGLPGATQQATHYKGSEGRLKTFS